MLDLQPADPLLGDIQAAGRGRRGPQQGQYDPDSGCPQGGEIALVQGLPGEDGSG